MGKDYKHWAQYGSIMLKRSYCEVCDQTALVMDNRLQCCGRKLNEFKTKNIKKMCGGKHRRKKPPLKVRKELLAEQDHRCFYCHLSFGTPIYNPKGNIVFLKIAYDHAIPYSYDYNNKKFVVACHVCNGIKSNLMFDDLKEARAYIIDKRHRKGYKLDI